MKIVTRFTVAALALAIVMPVVRAEELDDKRDREREKQEAKIEREQDLYENGTDAFDDQDWRRAAHAFEKVAEMHMTHAAPALYWLAASQNKMGMRSEALSTIMQLREAYPRSKWIEDAKALEIEIRQSSGQTIQPQKIDDEELKLMAINGLMSSDPEQAVPILDHLLQSSKSTKIKDRALFVLSQSSSPQAQQVLVRVAKNAADRDLQSRAIRYLGMMGGRNRTLLSEIYTSTSDVDVKRSVLKAYMLAGDRTQLLALAKGEPNPDLRAEAVMQLGLTGGKEELSQLYTTESSTEVRKKILQAMFIGGNAEKLFDIARNEPNRELKLTAIRNLGLLGGERTSRFLVSMYDSDSNQDVREAIINSLFIQGAAQALVDLARREKNPELKRNIVSKLSLMHAKVATDFLLETLKD